MLTELSCVDCMLCLFLRWLEVCDSPYYKGMSGPVAKTDKVLLEAD